jgi:hypothetical protein
LEAKVDDVMELGLESNDEPPIVAHSPSGPTIILDPFVFASLIPFVFAS